MIILFLLHANTTCAPMHPAQIVMANQTHTKSGKLNLNITVVVHWIWPSLPIVVRGHWSANILAHWCALRQYWGPNTRGQTLWYSRYISCTLTSFTSPIGGTNISVRLAYFHSNRLLKVVGIEKRGGLGGWLLFEDAFGPGRSMSVYFLMLSSSFPQLIFVSYL